MKNLLAVCVTSLLVLTLIACSGAKKVSLPPQSMDSGANRDFGQKVELEAGIVEASSLAQPADTEPADVATPAPAPPGAGARPAVTDSTLVVIGEENRDSAQKTLMEASIAERQRRQTAPAAVAVITNKNLAEHAAGGRLTYVEQSASAEIEIHLAGETSNAEEEIYWRTRVRTLRADWRRSHDLITELEAQAADLRRRFYAADDPYVRDRQIKPEWDRTLDRLEEARRGAERTRAELATALEEGRRSGAMPGWLRDGIELEPEPPKPPPDVPQTDAEEPKVIDP